MNDTTTINHIYITGVARVVRDYLFDIGKIVEGAANGDLDKVLSYCDSLATRLESAGEKAAAKRVRQIVGKSPASTLALTRSGGQPSLPIDGESRIAVADEERPVKGDISVCLSPECQRAVSQFLNYFQAADRLIASGVGISPSLLIYGPPGVGKTQLARYIAAELKYPLITARSDALISSYLGSTSKNLRMLFQHAASRPCVLFLDEFDAIAKMRDDESELGELKRVVISLMQNIDAMGRDHVLLAATNHQHLLDPAIWRRFAYKIEMDLPDNNMRAAMLKSFFGRFADDVAVEIGAALSVGMNGAQLRDIAENAIRDAVLGEREFVSHKDVVSKFVGESLPVQLHALYGFDKKKFTQMRLAQMFEISQSYVSQLLKQGIGDAKAPVAHESRPRRKT